MEVSSYFPSSSLKIANPVYYKLISRKSSNLSTKSSPISPSIGFTFKRRSNFKIISTTKRSYYKLNFIRACTVGESDPTTSSFGDVCWRLIKPYTVMGIVIVFCSLFARALIGSPNLVEWSLVIKALLGIFTLVCSNTYTTIINQIYDVEIDKINKPHYPIAAGDLSVESAWIMTVFLAVAGLSIVGFTCGTFIACIYGFSLFLGTAYSVPPLRLKESPLGTILCIPLEMGFVKNFGVYYAMRTTLGLPFQWSVPLVFIIIFVSVITGVMAFMKDLPDVDGDTKFGIKTLPSILGIRNTAHLGFGILLLNYVAAVVAAIYMPQALKPSLTIPVHLILSLCLIYQMRVLEQSNYTKEASEGFYRFIWNLYIAEYILFPFI